MPPDVALYNLGEGVRELYTKGLIMNITGWFESTINRNYLDALNVTSSWHHQPHLQRRNLMPCIPCVLALLLFFFLPAGYLCFLIQIFGETKVGSTISQRLSRRPVGPPTATCSVFPRRMVPCDFSIGRPFSTGTTFPYPPPGTSLLLCAKRFNGWESELPSVLVSLKAYKSFNDVLFQSDRIGHIALKISEYSTRAQ
jgi:hypothetical protein